MFFKGYSLMVEQWSSKSHAWVRFLLSLFLKTLPFERNQRNQRNRRNSGLFKKYIKNRNSRLLSHLAVAHIKRSKRNTKYLQKFFNPFYLENSVKSFAHFKRNAGLLPNKLSQINYSKEFFKQIVVTLSAIKTQQLSSNLLKNNFLNLNAFNSTNFGTFLRSRKYFVNFILFLSVLTKQDRFVLKHTINFITFFYNNNFVNLAKLYNFYKIFLTSYKNIELIEPSIGIFNLHRRYNNSSVTNVSMKHLKYPNFKFKQFLRINNFPIQNSSRQIKRQRYFLIKNRNNLIANFYFNARMLIINKSTIREAYPHYGLANLFFKTFNALTTKRVTNAYRISQFDKINETLIAITRDSLNFNKFNFYKIQMQRDNAHPNVLLKLPKSRKIYKVSNILSLANNLNINNSGFLESNFFFIKFNKFFPAVHKQKFKKTFFFINKLFLYSKNFTSSSVQFAAILKDAPYVYNSSYATNLPFSAISRTRQTPRGLSSAASLSYSQFSKMENIFCIFFKPLFFKIVFYGSILTGHEIPGYSDAFYAAITKMQNLFFYSNEYPLFRSNFLPNDNFSYMFRKKIVKIFDYSKFSMDSTLWHYQTLMRFLEFCSGKRAHFRLCPFLATHLNVYEKAQCLIWSQKVKYFRKVLGPRLFLNESLQILYLALKLKDPFVLSNWMVSTMQKISFWKYKTFLRYLKYVLRYFFWGIFKYLNVKGIKFQLKGKVSVAGNARTRTVFHTVGATSHATFNNKILYNLSLIKTFTGVLGLKLWIVF